MEKQIQIENPKARLDELATEIEFTLGKIDVITNDISEGFFSLDMTTEMGRLRAAVEFDTARTKTDIVRDYLNEVKKKAEKLCEVSEVIFDILKNIEVTANA